MKIAFIFPGQGSQYVGMGSALYRSVEIAKQTFDEASDVVGWDMAKLCFEGPEEKLNQTEFTQPAILTASIAVWRSLALTVKEGVCVAGHSLGEYTALVAAEAISFRDAVSIVSQRGAFMQAAMSTGGMAALVGLDRKTVEEVCQKAAADTGGVVVPANFNAPDQIVIAGEKEALEKAMALAAERGAKRAIRLAVSVPSHSPLMKPACRQLETALSQINGKDPLVPLVNNFQANVMTTWAEILPSLVNQLAYPLLWEPSIQTIRTLGADFFIEIGPGRVLSGLLKRIDRTLRVMNVEDSEGIEKARLALHLKGTEG